MKLRRNANYSTIINRLKDLSEQSSALQKDYAEVMRLLEDPKLGISEVDYKMEEDVMRFKSCFEKIEELMRSF
jgi:hypothetical protein